MKLETEPRINQGPGFYPSLLDILRKIAQVVNPLVDSDSTQAALLEQAAPPGASGHFYRNTAPAGWLKANGAAVSRTAYAALFAAIGTTYGVGDGSTTFNLPDARGEFLRGWDDARGVDVSRAFGSAQADAFQGHWHSAHSAADGVFGGSTVALLRSTGAGGVAASGAYAASNSATSDFINGTPRTAAETRPRNLAALACIKY